MATKTTSWLTRLFRRTTPKAETRSYTLEDILGVGSLSDAIAGMRVDESTAINLSVVYGCINAIAQDLASISLNVYQSMPNGAKRKATEHDLWYLLHDSPNEELTSEEFRFALIANTLRWGNGYAEIERARGGQPIALHLIPPAAVTPKRDDKGKLYYKINGAERDLAPENIIHIKCLGSPSGDVGFSPIKQAKQAISLGLAAEAFGSAFFGNSGRPGGVISHPETLSDDAIKNLRTSIQSVHGGAENYGKWLILEEGASVTPFAVPPEDAQFLATRTFQVQEICRYYRVPSSIINENSNNTFSNSVEEGLRYVTHCLRPWAVRIEKHINKKLFGQGYYCEHLLDSLMRGNSLDRTTALKEQFLNGALTLNEWREIENRNPVEDPTQHFMQGQMRTLEQIQAGQEETKTEPEAPPEPEPKEDPLEGLRSEVKSLIEAMKTYQPPYQPEEREAPATQPEPQKLSIEATDALRAVLVDSVGRMVRREATAIKRAANHPSEFINRVDEFFEKHQPFFAEAVEPSVRAWLVVTGSTADPYEVTQTLVATVVTEDREAILALAGEVTAKDLVGAVERWAEQLEATRANEVVEALSE